MELIVGGRALFKNTYPYVIKNIDHNNVTLLKGDKESIENIRDLTAIRSKEIDGMDMEELFYLAKEQGKISNDNILYAITLRMEDAILPKGYSGYSEDFLEIGESSIGKYILEIEKGIAGMVTISVSKASEWFKNDRYSYITCSSFMYYKGYCGVSIMKDNFSGDFLLFDTEEEITKAVADIFKIDIKGEQI